KGLYPRDASATAAEYEVAVERALGTPSEQAAADSMAKVVLYLPEGRYALRSRAKFVAENGAVSTIDLDKFDAVDAFPAHVIHLRVTGCLELQCPTDLNVECQSPEGPFVKSPSPTGMNPCSGKPVAWDCFPPSGSLFPPGQTKVQCWGPILENGEAAYCEFL